MDTTQPVEKPHDPLAQPRQRVRYNAAERRFSQLLSERLHELLEARRDQLDLLRRYPKEPERLGIIATPPDLPRDQLRLSVVEKMIWKVLDFVRSDAIGSPVEQSIAPDGRVVEHQTFPTKFPHIIIERADYYEADSPDPVEITWSLQRVQNQHIETQINRVLNIASLVFDVMRLIRKR